MNWPALSDYQEAIQNPKICFQDPTLRYSSPELDPIGLPRVASGNFASVYKMANRPNYWAVRCFSNPVTDQQERYSLLSQHLGKLNIPALASFQYIMQGIRVKGQWYPIIKMEWVDGSPLHEFIRQNLYNPNTLKQIADQLLTLVETLRNNNLAHGDLQHGNILVNSQGQIRLVDYDAMFLPPLSGRNCPEVGHPNYQHPGRTSYHYNIELDSFATLVIYLSLKALATDPNLWKQFNTGENLILSSSDYKSPQRSQVFVNLKRSSDFDVRELSSKLENCCSVELGKIQNVDVLIRKSSSVSNTVHTSTQASKQQTGITIKTISIPSQSKPATTFPPPQPTPPPVTRSSTVAPPRQPRQQATTVSKSSYIKTHLNKIKIWKVSMVFAFLTDITLCILFAILPEERNTLAFIFDLFALFVLSFIVSLALLYSIKDMLFRRSDAVISYSYIISLFLTIPIYLMLLGGKAPNGDFFEDIVVYSVTIPLVYALVFIFTYMFVNLGKAVSKLYKDW